MTSEIRNTQSMSFLGYGKGNEHEEMNHDRLVNGAIRDHGLLLSCYASDRWLFVPNIDYLI
jgi:hypothetical protein